ncbi:AI-2E family transporter [Frigidibacter sp. SD6-1]|uniref:AI-2E family transporter n=1 Tax=Frigidibacter sp. SD6-1 TaxID=3032581 RepID=UPI0024DFD20F|nr:AI-2E family transporter [Frigidibacter sp. SD6-1]
MAQADDIEPIQPQRPMVGSAPGASVASIRVLVTIVAVCTILYVARDLVLPLVLGMLFAFILTPVVNYLRAHGLRDTAAVTVTVVATSMLVGSFLLILIYQVGQIGANLPQYQGNVLAKVDTLLAAGTENEIISHLQGMVERISERLDAQTTETASNQAMKVELVEQTSLMAWLTDVILPALTPVGVFGLIFIVVIFALLERGTLRDRLVQLIGGSNILATSRLLEEAGMRVSKFLVAQLTVNAIYAVPIWLGLWVIGVPNALFFGLVTLVMRFVPYIGSAVSAVLPLLMAVAVSSGWSIVLWTVALFLLVELVTSYVIEPWFYAQQTGMSPLGVIVSAMFWTWLWGPMGLIIATPLTVCLVVIGHHVPGLRLFPIMLGDEPVLTESARLYDRLLAGRSLDFTEAAASTTRQRHLADYYDQTAIPALALARVDHEAGLLSDYQVQRIASAAWTLAEELETVVEDELANAEEEPSEEGANSLVTNGILDGIGARVAVIGAQSELDAVAAMMLGQSLRAEGAEALVLPLRAAIPRALGKFEPTALIIVTLDAVVATPVPLLVRLIRRRLPGVGVSVARWAIPVGQAQSPTGKERNFPVAEGMEAVFATVFGKEAPAPSLEKPLTPVSPEARPA